ncbi:hypothetical protein [Streptomyces sp. NPDC059071]|uniref:hypothetical protein n=1 Tax=unclassified Streptomyces TaxID=2593676 RepID=UPI00364E6A92
MPKDVGTRLAALERRLAVVERSSRLSSAALDDTALEIRDTGGSLRAIVGQQPDGTTAVNVVNGPVPPQPTTPLVQSVLGGIAATWDGSFTDGAVTPLDFARVEVHASTTSGFTPTAETLQNTIETPQGATVTVPADGPRYVRLVTRNTSGTPSTPSVQNGPVAPAPVVADDVPDDVLIGKVIQTGTTGRRVVISPDAGGNGIPGIALHSGHPSEYLPGLLSSTTIDLGGGLQPRFKVEAPYINSGNAQLDLISPSDDLGGQWSLDTRTSRSWCFIQGTGGAETGISTIKAYAQDGASGPSALIQATGSEVRLQRGLSVLLVNNDGVAVSGNLSSDSLTVASTAWQTYTPVVTGAGSPTFTTRTGWYRLLGDEVFFCAYIVIGATAGSGTSAVSVTAPTLIDRTTRQVVDANGDGMTGNSGSLQALALPGTVTNVFDRIRNSTGNNVNGSALVTGATLTIQGSYRRG